MGLEQSECCRQWAAHCAWTISKDEIENWKRSISRQRWSVTVINKDVFQGPLTTNHILIKTSRTAQELFEGEATGFILKIQGVLMDLFHVDETFIVSVTGDMEGLAGGLSMCSVWTGELPSSLQLLSSQYWDSTERNKRGQERCHSWKEAARCGLHSWATPW